MQPFIYTTHPVRVIFGFGTLAQLPAEVERLGLSRVLVLATPQQASDAQEIASRLGERSAGIYAGATMHTPVAVTEEAMQVVAERRVDGLVAVGGGSTTGLAKAIALRTDLPQIVAPTTYAGSEMTPILGETREGAKVTQSSPKILPEVVIYDVDLTLSLPPRCRHQRHQCDRTCCGSALCARSQSCDQPLATEAIRTLARALPIIVAHPQDREVRSDALYGAWLCGTCLGAVGMSLHHKLCHTLGGSFDLPHAETHTAVLPHALAYNAPSIPEVIKQLADVLGTNDPARALYDLAGSVGACHALRDLGMPASGNRRSDGSRLGEPLLEPAATGTGGSPRSYCPCLRRRPASKLGMNE